MSRYFARSVRVAVPLIVVLSVTGSCSVEKPERPPAKGGGQCVNAEFPPRPQSACVIPPAPPRACALPSAGIRVTDVEALKDALAERSARDIILADGVYDSQKPFVPAAPHRLWGATLGGAVLKAGIVFRAGYGPEVHCLTFDVDDGSKGGNGDSIISAYGSADGLRVTDSFFDGQGAMHRAIIARAINGVHLQRLVMRNFHNDGIRVVASGQGGSDEERIANPPVYIGDVDIAHIRDPDPDCCHGTSEFGIMLGTRGLVERIKVRDADWSCIVTAVRPFGSVLRDLDLDDCAGASVYLEHRTAFTTIEYFRIGPDTRVGVTLEGGQPRWNIDDPRWNWKAVGPGNVIRHGVIDSRNLGVNVAPCNAETTVEDVTFLNQCVTGILNGAALHVGSCPAPRPGGGTSADSNTYVDNHFSGMGPDAVPVLDSGWRAARKRCTGRSYARAPLPASGDAAHGVLAICASRPDLSASADGVVCTRQGHD